ncbi:MAG: hypothetical protein ACLR13_09720 [Acutalibacteraceae bacterium]
MKRKFVNQEHSIIFTLPFMVLVYSLLLPMPVYNVVTGDQTNWPRTGIFAAAGVTDCDYCAIILPLYPKRKGQRLQTKTMPSVISEKS